MLGLCTPLPRSIISLQSFLLSLDKTSVGIAQSLNRSIILVSVVEGGKPLMFSD
jgi:hypothetical protein